MHNWKGPAPTQEELRERVAAYIHEIWRGWMRHFRHRSPEGWKAILSQPREMWRSQMNSSYSDLENWQKVSLRHHADRILSHILGEDDCRHRETERARFDGTTFKFWERTECGVMVMKTDRYCHNCRKELVHGP